MAGSDVYRALIASILLSFSLTWKIRIGFIVTSAHLSGSFPDSTPSAQLDFL